MASPAHFFRQRRSKYSGRSLLLLKPTEHRRTDRADICNFLRMISFFRVMNTLSIILHVHVDCTYGYILYILTAASGSVHEGLWELSDSMVSYYEKLPFLDAVAMETGVLGVCSVCIQRSHMLHKNSKWNQALNQACLFLLSMSELSLCTIHTSFPQRFTVVLCRYSCTSLFDFLKNCLSCCLPAFQLPSKKALVNQSYWSFFILGYVVLMWCICCAHVGWLWLRR